MSFEINEYEKEKAGFLETALCLASINIPVFPLREKSKIPIYPGGFKIAKADEKQIRDWWTEHPNANIGVPTGTPSGIVVIDIDGRKGEESFAELTEKLGPLPETVTAITPGKMKDGEHLGQGRHLFFRMDGVTFSCKTNICPGIDIRGDGGYIVVPPSVHPDGTGRYSHPTGQGFGEIKGASLPEKWADFIQGPKKPEKKDLPKPTAAQKPQVLNIDPKVLNIDPVLEKRAEAYLAAMPGSISGENGHNALLAAVGALYWGFGFDEQKTKYLIHLYFNPRCQPEWSEKEIDHKIADIPKFPSDKPRGHLLQSGAITTKDEESDEGEPNHEWLPCPIDSFPQQTARFIGAAAKSIGIDPSFIAVLLLSVISGMIGRLFCIKLKENYFENASVWVMIISPSGNAKSICLKIVLEPCQKLQKEAGIRYEEEMKEHKKRMIIYEQSLSEWRREPKSNRSADPPEKPEEPILERILVIDATTEAVTEILSQNPYGSIMPQDEMSGLLECFDAYRPGGKDLPYYLSIFNGTSIRCDRKGKAPLIAHTPSLAILGTIQPGIWRKIISENPHFDSSGLYSRILAVMPPTQPILWSENVLSDDVKGQYEKMVRTIHSFRKLKIPPDQPIVFSLSPGAKDVWREFFNENAFEGFALEDDTGKTVYAKMPTYTARFALILHVLECLEADLPLNEWPREVSQETMAKAVALTEWFKNESARILHKVQGKMIDIDKESAIILSKLKEKGEITIRELQRSSAIFNKKDGALIIEQKLQELIEKRLIKFREVIGQNNKPLVYYSLNDTVDTDDTDIPQETSGESSVNVNVSLGVVGENPDGLVDSLENGVSPEADDKCSLPFKERSAHYINNCSPMLVEALYRYFNNLPLPDGFNSGGWPQKLSMEETEFFRTQVTLKRQQNILDAEKNGSVVNDPQPSPSPTPGLIVPPTSFEDENQ